MTGKGTKVNKRAFGNVFYQSRKRGKSSPKSVMLFSKAGPKFSKLTPQQQKVADTGKKCGDEIRGKYEGSGQVKARRKAMGDCARKAFGR